MSAWIVPYSADHGRKAHYLPHSQPTDKINPFVLTACGKPVGELPAGVAFLLEPTYATDRPIPQCEACAKVAGTVLYERMVAARDGVTQSVMAHLVQDNAPNGNWAKALCGKKPMDYYLANGWEQAGSLYRLCKACERSAKKRGIQYG